MMKQGSTPTFFRKIFQKFNSIIANLAINKNFENLQLQPIPIEVKKQKYSK